VREYFTDKAKTGRLDMAQVEAWGVKHRHADTVRVAEGPEVPLGDNHQLHARVGGVWVRVWVSGWRRLPPKAEEELSASAVRMRKLRAAQAPKDNGVCG